MKYHVHVYLVSNKYETNIEAENDVIAKQGALDLAKQGKLIKVKGDCKFIAISFEGGALIGGKP